MIFHTLVCIKDSPCGPLVQVVAPIWSNLAGVMQHQSWVSISARKQNATIAFRAIGEKTLTFIHKMYSVWLCSTLHIITHSVHIISSKISDTFQSDVRDHINLSVSHVRADVSNYRQVIQSSERMVLGSILRGHYSRCQNTSKS